MEKYFVVTAIHGEGCRDTVNSLQSHRNSMDAKAFLSAGRAVPDRLLEIPDESPDVVVVLRDPNDPTAKMEFPLNTWDEVEEWKILAGWDADKRHWKLGASVKVTIGA